MVSALSHWFRLPRTHDKKNRIFKGGEQIAIPYRGILRWNVPKITYLNQEEDILNQEKYNIMFLPVKFVGSCESKKAYTAGYFLFQLKFDYEGELIRKDCRHKITVGRKEFKYGVEKKFENDLSFEIASKVKEGFPTQDLAGLLKSKTSTGFANKMAEIFIIPVEFSLKKTFKLNKKS